MGRRTWLVRVVFAAAVACAWCCARGQTSAGAPTTDGASADRSAPVPRKVLHLHVRGDLDSMKLAREFAERVAAAHEEGVEVLLLELSGDRWRADAVHAMARALRPSSAGGAAAHRAGLRTMVLLHDDADRRVGFGQAALALLADQCAVSPKTRVVFEASTDLRDAAPPETDWEMVDRELQGALYLSARDRQADVLLAALLPRPTGPLWAVPGSAADAPWRLSTNAVEDTRRVLVAPGNEPELPARVELDRVMLRRLGIANLEGADVGQMLAAAGLRARPILRAELASGLAQARGKIEQVIRQLDECLSLVDADIGRANKLRGQDAAKRKREAGEGALRLIIEAERRLLDAEGVMTDYPELLAGLPPGRTPVGQEAEKHPMLWRWLFQDRRDQITSLRAQAEALARTP